MVLDLLGFGHSVMTCATIVVSHGAVLPQVPWPCLFPSLPPAPEDHHLPRVSIVLPEFHGVGVTHSAGAAGFDQGLGKCLGFDPGDFSLRLWQLFLKTNKQTRTTLCSSNPALRLHTQEQKAGSQTQVPSTAAHSSCEVEAPSAHQQVDGEQKIL